MAVPHDAVATVGQFQVLPLGDEGVGFRDQHLGQHSAGTFTRNFGQGIIDSFGLTERDDGGISRHGVSLLSGGSGRLDTRLDTPPSVKRRHPDSRIALRPLAVTTAVRSEALPDLPTVSDFVPGYESSGWYGVGVPRDTPVVIIDKLNKEINAGPVYPKLKARFADLGATVFTGSPADFGKLIADETEKWGKVIRAANIKPV
jgi:hypothetical protein